MQNIIKTSSIVLSLGLLLSTSVFGSSTPISTVYLGEDVSYSPIGFLPDAGGYGNSTFFDFLAVDGTVAAVFDGSGTCGLLIPGINLCVQVSPPPIDGTFNAGAFAYVEVFDNQAEIDYIGIEYRYLGNDGAMFGFDVLDETFSDIVSVGMDSNNVFVGVSIDSLEHGFSIFQMSLPINANGTLEIVSVTLAQKIPNPNTALSMLLGMGILGLCMRRRQTGLLKS